MYIYIYFLREFFVVVGNVCFGYISIVMKGLSARGGKCGRRVRSGRVRSGGSDRRVASTGRTGGSTLRAHVPLPWIIFSSLWFPPGRYYVYKFHLNMDLCGPPACPHVIYYWIPFVAFDYCYFSFSIPYFEFFLNFSTWCYLIEFWRCWVVYEPATLKWHVYGSPWRRSISIGGRNVSFRWETPGVMNIPRLMNSMRFSGWQYEALTWIYEFMRALDSAKRVIEKPWNESQQNCQWTFNRFRPRGRGPGKMSSPGIH